jgi:hypothetical protein
MDVSIRLAKLAKDTRAVRLAPWFRFTRTVQAGVELVTDRVVPAVHGTNGQEISIDPVALQDAPDREVQHAFWSWWISPRISARWI